MGLASPEFEGVGKDVRRDLYGSNVQVFQCHTLQEGPSVVEGQDADVTLARLGAHGALVFGMVGETHGLVRRGLGGWRCDYERGLVVFGPEAGGRRRARQYQIKGCGRKLVLARDLLEEYLVRFLGRIMLRVGPGRSVYDCCPQ